MSRPVDVATIEAAIIVLALITTVFGFIAVRAEGTRSEAAAIVQPTPDVDGLGAETTLHGVVGITPME